MGYFAAAYNIFTPVYSVTAAVIPAVITKLVASYRSTGRYRSVRKIRRVALRASVLLGLLGAGVIALAAVPFAVYALGTPEAVPSMLVIAPSVLFCCISAVYKGYYEGLSDMSPTALSQIIEAITKAAAGILLSGFILERTGSLPYAAAAAVFGVSISELCGFGFLFIRTRRGHDGISRSDMLSSPEAERILSVLKEMFREMLPLTFCAGIMSIVSFIDMMSVTSCINFAVNADRAYFIAKYTYGAGLSSMSPAETGNFIYGCYSGIAVSLFSIIPALTALFGKSALPEIAAAWNLRDKDRAHRALGMMLKGTFVVGLPLCFGLAAVAEPLLSLLYSSKPAEAALSLPPLVVLSVGGIFLSLWGTVACVLTALGRSDVILKIMLCGSAVKLALNIILIRIPEINIVGASVATVSCYLLVSVIGFAVIKRMFGLRVAPTAMFWKSAVPAALCALVAWSTDGAFSAEHGAVVSLVLSVGCGAAVYVALTVLLDFRYVVRVLKSLRHK
jgi:stage V sporulation protein B